MSGKLAGFVWDSALPGRLKPLAACLADLGSHDGSGIFPSVEYLMWLLEVGETTIRTQMSELRKLGVLQPMGSIKGGRKLGGKGNVPTYRMVVEKLPKRPPWEQVRTGRIKGSDFEGNDKGSDSEPSRVQIPPDKGSDSDRCNKEEPLVEKQPLGEALVLAPPSSDAKPTPQLAVTTQDKAKRHTAFKDKIFAFYLWKWGRVCPWDGSEAKQLSNLLASDPKLTIQEFSRWLYNYSESKDITPGERPRAFLPRIHSYSVTKLNQFRQDADVRTETFDSSRVRNTDDAFTEAARNLASASSNGSDTASGDDDTRNPDVGNLPRTILAR